MQVIIDWLIAHSALVILVVYELWALIPEAIVKSSSILTLIGELLKSWKDKAPAP